MAGSDQPSVPAALSADRQRQVRYRPVLAALGSVAAPASVVTGLAYYIGVQRETALAGVFGLDVSVLGLSTREYVLRSADTLVRFLAVLFVVMLVSAALVAELGRHLAGRPDRVRHRTAAAALVVGGVLLLFALFRLFEPVRLSYLSLVHPVSLIAGAALVTGGLVAVRMHRARQDADRGRSWRVLIVVPGVGLGLLGLFWAANDYAFLQGQERGVQIRARIDALPRATVYSRSPLPTTSDAVTERFVTASDGERVYQYEGLRLLLRSGGRYFLVPEEPQGRQPVVVLAEAHVDWIEFRT